MLQQVDLCGQEKKRHHTQLNHSVDSIHSAYIIFEFKRMWTMKIDGGKKHQPNGMDCEWHVCGSLSKCDNTQWPIISKAFNTRLSLAMSNQRISLILISPHVGVFSHSMNCACVSIFFLSCHSARAINVWQFSHKKMQPISMTLIEFILLYV